MADWVSSALRSHRGKGANSIDTCMIWLYRSYPRGEEGGILIVQMISTCLRGEYKNGRGESAPWGVGCSNSGAASLGGGGGWDGDISTKGDIKRVGFFNYIHFAVQDKECKYLIGYT